MGQQAVEGEESGHLGTVIIENYAHVSVSKENLEIWSKSNLQQILIEYIAVFMFGLTLLEQLLLQLKKL